MLLDLIVASVIINEITWMGTDVSPNDEWIELYNNSAQEVNLDGWVLKADDGTPEINLAGTFPAQDFYLLERTDDETVPGIPADLIYKGALGNSGENLKLYDEFGNLIDQANFGDGWPAGDNKTKQTMERKKDDAWQTSAEPGGTPKKENGEQRAEIRSPLIETPKPAEIGSPPVYPAGIVLNEILPSPEGADETNEWIEIFNQNDFEIDLSSWKIEDTTGKIATYTLNTKIPGLGYLVLYRPETKITLNNDIDGLNLINPAGKIADLLSFEKAPLGQSYNKTPSGWLWSTTLTPGKENIIPAEVRPRATESPTSGETAAIGEKIINLLPEENKSRSLWLLLIASMITIFSVGIIWVILFLKKTRTNQLR